MSGLALRHTSSLPQLRELSPKALGKKMHGLNKTQKKLKWQGYIAKLSKVGVGFVPTEPIKILVKTKKTKASTQHITFEDVEESIGSNFTPRTLVFDRIKAPTTWASVST